MREKGEEEGEGRDPKQKFDKSSTADMVPVGITMLLN